MVNNINNLLGVMLSADISGQQLLKELMFRLTCNTVVYLPFTHGTFISQMCFSKSCLTTLKHMLLQGVVDGA
jgi:hypothetical protein